MRKNKIQNKSTPSTISKHLIFKNTTTNKNLQNKHVTYQKKLGKLEKGVIK